MRGHIVKRGKDSYSVKIGMGRDPVTRKYKYQWVSVKGTKKDAEKRLSEILHQIDTGTFQKPGKLTLAEFLVTWLADVAKHNLSPRGFERYAGIIRQHIIPDMGAIALTQLRLDHLQKHYTALLDKGLNPKTVRYHHAVIHRALQTAVKRGLVRHNVATGAEMPAIRRNEMQVWDADEVTRFLETAKASPYYALFHSAIYTGMRRSELLALRWQDVDLILSQVYVNRGLHHLKDGSYVFTEPKSAKSRRTIALSPAAVLVLRAHHEKRGMERAMMGKTLSPEDLAFSKPEGEPYRPNTITRAWSMLAAEAGVKVIRFHDARHTHASLMLKQNVHPRIVQERLGHSSITITLDIYSHVAPGLQQAAAESFDKVLNPRHENVVTENA